VCQEVVPLQPPSGFSDGQELSEAECDREAASGCDSAAALPLFRHEELEQELSTLVKRFVMTPEVSRVMEHEASSSSHEVVPVPLCTLYSSVLNTSHGRVHLIFTMLYAIRNGK
jgi:hypothetical protein